MAEVNDLDDIKAQFSGLYLNRLGVWSVGIEADANGRPLLTVRVDRQQMYGSLFPGSSRGY